MVYFLPIGRSAWEKRGCLMNTESEHSELSPQTTSQIHGTSVTIVRPALTHHLSPTSKTDITVTLGGEHSMGLGKCSMIHINHYSVISKNFTVLKILYLTFPNSDPSATTELYIVSILLPFSGCHVVRILQYVAFSDWILSCSNMHLSFFPLF